jgi:hypothetical protein
MGKGRDTVESVKMKVIASTDCVRDCSVKPGAKKRQFSQAKKATKGSSFWVIENGIFVRTCSGKPDPCGHAQKKILPQPLQRRGDETEIDCVKFKLSETSSD